MPKCDFNKAAKHVNASILRTECLKSTIETFQHAKLVQSLQYNRGPSFAMLGALWHDFMHVAYGVIVPLFLSLR